MASVDHRSAADIEREIADERSALTRTLDEIQDRLSFGALSDDVMARVRTNSSDIGHAVARNVKENPIPLAVTALGLVWLIASQRSGSHSDPYDRVAASPSSGRMSGTSTVTDYRDPASAGKPASLYDASGRPLPHEDDGESRWGRARGAVSGAGDSMSSRLREGGERVSSQAGSAADRARMRAQSARGSLSRWTQGAYASADELRHRITEGTEGLSKSARARVLEARTRAYEAQLMAERYASRGREKATDFFDEQPLVAGALALAVGAAIGALLPRTSREDHAFGSYRDQVFDEAERIYREERSKVEAVVRETANEARNIARDVAEDVQGDVEEGIQRTGDIARSKFAEAEGKAKDAAKDVADTARSEAEKQDLGKQGKVS